MAKVMTTQNSAMGDEELRDNDGNAVSEIREFYKDHYGALDDVEMDILLHVHDHSKCATGIWLQVGLSDLANLIKSRDQQIALAARIDELEREDEAERELFRSGKNPDTSGYRDDRLEELKQAQNKEK